jgi:hypothetical protein
VCERRKAGPRGGANVGDGQCLSPMVSLMYGDKATLVRMGPEYGYTQSAARMVVGGTNSGKGVASSATLPDVNHARQSASPPAYTPRSLRRLPAGLVAGTIAVQTLANGDTDDETLCVHQTSCTCSTSGAACEIDNFGRPHRTPDTPREGRLKTFGTKLNSNVYLSNE